MAISLTKYIYPIKEEITLSNFLGISIDNPRTEEEVQFVKEYINPALVRHYEGSKPHHNPRLSAAFAISNWKKIIKGNDEYVDNYLLNFNETAIEDIISQSWIIIRYSDNGEFEKIKQDKGRLFHIFYTDARHDYWDKYNLLLSYCQLISLLIHDHSKQYFGDSLVLLKKPQDIFYPVDHTHEIIEAFSIFHHNCGNDERVITWDFFPDIRDQLVQVANSLEQIISVKPEPSSNKKQKKQSPKEKVLFIGDLLRVIENETNDVNVKLLLLVSIIEFMVTRNPDTGRFNVEDSISKQFVLKSSILIYQNDKTRDLAALQKKLKLIYNQRSNVAHGNHMSKEDRQEILESFYLLFEFIRAIFSEYLNDPVFVDFLKEN